MTISITLDEEIKQQRSLIFQMDSLFIKQQKNFQTSIDKLQTFHENSDEKSNPTPLQNFRSTLNYHPKRFHPLSSENPIILSPKRITNHKINQHRPLATVPYHNLPFLLQVE